MITRREVLRGAVAGAGLILVACQPDARSPRSNGRPPVARTSGAASLAPTRSARGTIQGFASAGSMEVPAGETLRFEPSADTTLELTGNLVVRGRLEMRPQPGVEHVLRFVDVDESAFVGGGLDPIDSDVGLWVMGEGQLDVAGTQKEAWNRTATSSGWESRDELVVAPVDAGDFAPKPFSPGDDVPTFRGRRAEVLNLSRNVRIEGAPGGRAHVFIRSTRPQSIRYATLRHLGPRQASGEFTEGVLGRYGLHFHMCHLGSHGSVVEGVVVRDCGGHAFVPHMSHGIGLRDCIAYEVFDEAFWWDPHDETHELLVDRCVAAAVHFDPEHHGHRLAGFLLGAGRRLAMMGCVAVAVQGGKTAAGYVWPEAPSGLWRFEGNLAHNNLASGIFVWQNVREPHRIRGFTAYNNGSHGIHHGAYVNSYHYQELDLRDQRDSILLLAAGRADPRGRPQSWVDVEGGALEVCSHNLPGEVPVLFHRCSFPAGVTLDDAGGEPGALDLVDCGLDPRDFDVVSLHPESIVRVQHAEGSAFRLTASGASDINPFFPY